MLGFNGGRMGKQNSTGFGSAGLYFQNEQSIARRAGQWVLGPNEAPAIGTAFQGGYFAGYISHTANGAATHALIISPAVTGGSGTGYTITTQRQQKTSGTDSPGTLSVFDGRANTDAMISLGISLFPAAQFCVGLNIGGYTDWYLPSSLELDILYNNLKPTTASNLTTSGINAYAVPPRATNRTATVPGQTGLTLFQAPSGAERIRQDTLHASSTQATVGNCWVLAVNNGSIEQGVKNSTFAVRAIRRVSL